MGENGLELARWIYLHNIDTEVVFFTAFKEFALEAFEVFAFDYIVKPVTQQRLELTIRRILNKRKGLKPAEAYVKLKSDHKAAVYCLGSMDVRVKQGVSVRWISSKSIELFSYLLLNNGRLVSRQIILDEVFPGMTRKNAEVYLNTAVYQMRKSLEQHDLRSVILTRMDCYGLDLKDIYIDFVDFQRRAKEIGAVSPNNLEDALSIEELYKGDIFGDRSYLWSLPERQMLFELYATHIKKLVNLMLKLNSTDAASRLAKKLIRFDELNEDSNCLLLRIYAANKDKAELSNHYEGYIKALYKELGVKPSRNLVNLYAELRMNLD
jgi:two-component SAPR family response regulator